MEVDDGEMVLRCHGHGDEISIREGGVWGLDIEGLSAEDLGDARETAEVVCIVDQGADDK